MKPMCQLFNEMENTGNGILERFIIIVPDCRKVDPDVRESAYERMNGKGVSIEDIYATISQLNSNSEFYYSLESLR